MQSGTVKWYSSEKKYGFIKPTDGSKDIFVHATDVVKAGLSTLVEGQKVWFGIGTSSKGQIYAKDISLLEDAPKDSASAHAQTDDDGRTCGTVKFFRSDKGYGFIVPEKGDGDVFVHISEVTRAGFASLSKGQSIRFRVEVNSRNGRNHAVALKT